ncbi:MAG: hypothetical protein JW771_08085 [Candidatus Thermoplasmatota archaeon]|nr:hypothetical protein [Candidatus Thermoplasmatota archaeon]
MKKIVVVIIAATLLSTISGSMVIASTGEGEHHNDYSNEYAQEEQPDSDDIPGMNRAEDRTRNKDS